MKRTETRRWRRKIQQQLTYTAKNRIGSCKDASLAGKSQQIVEYKHVLSEIARLDDQTQKFGPIATVILIAAFVYAVNSANGFVYVILPFLLVAGAQYVLASVYGLFANWICAVRYEMLILENVPEGVPKDGHRYPRYMVRFLKRSDRGKETSLRDRAQGHARDFFMPARQLALFAALTALIVFLYSRTKGESISIATGLLSKKL